jgi:DNA-binding beta-propeller fold protein YncE
MDFGIDGKLYTLGYDGTVHGLFRLDENEFTRVAELPHGGIGLTHDSSGLLYTATSFEQQGEVWIIDPTSGVASLLASGLASPAGIAFDPTTSKLYVVEQHGDRVVYAITNEPTPVRMNTWGMLKARYR